MEKQDLVARINELSAMLMNEEEIRALYTSADTEYKELKIDISDKYAQATLEAFNVRAAAVKEADDAYDARINALATERERLSAEAESYRQQLISNADAVSATQTQYSEELTRLQAELQAIEEEEARQEAEAKKAEAARKAEEQKKIEEAQKARIAERQTLSTTNRPRIKF